MTSTRPIHISPRRVRVGRSPKAATAALAAAALLAACGDSGGSETETGGNADGGGTADAGTGSADAGEGAIGGTLRFAVGSDAQCADPQQVGSNDTIYWARQLVDSLTDQDPETGEIVPWLAESWKVNDDASAYTFTLVEGATFSDGTTVDAEAAKANFDRAIELGGRAGLVRGYLDGYVGTEVEDDRTFTISFEGPNAQFLQATSTHSLGLLTPESAALSDDERCAGVIGSGPFVLDNYVANESISLSVREDYDWGSSLWGHSGRAYLDTIEVSIVPEAGVRIGSLTSGQVDLIGNIGPQDEVAVTGTDIELLPRSNPGIPFGLRLNHENELFEDADVREAIAIAVNREEIVEVVHTSFANPASSVLASTTPFYADQSEYLGFDPDRAVELLEDAGFTQGSDGIYERDGLRAAFEILWFNNAATNGPSLELIQQQLAAVGVEVTLREGQIAEWQGILAEGSYDVNWGNITRADPDILRGNYHSGLSNNYRLQASELDDLLEGQSATSDVEERTELTDQIQEYVVSNYLEIPIVELTTVLAAGPEVHGVRFDASSRIHLYDTWIEQ